MIMVPKTGHLRKGAMMRLAVGVATVALLVGAGVSAAAPSQANRADDGKNLVWAIQTNPASLFDAFCFCSVGQTVMSLVQDHMLAPGTFGQPTTGAGAVVSGWKIVSPTVYRYTVKPGIKFSDGSTLTAADVAFSLNVHRDPATASRLASFFGNVKSVGSKGNVVTVQLKKADSNWQYVPTATPGLIYSQAHYLKNKAAYGTPGALPIGTGPYRFKEWQPNAKIVLDRNPHYKGKKYPYDTITIPIIPNEQALLLAMQSGQIDGTFAVPAANFGSWQKAQNTKVGRFNSGGWRGFSFDMEDGPFQDVNVRRALAYSLDMEGANKALNSGLGQVLTGMPPLLFLRGILPKAEIDAALKKVPKYPYSVAKAKAELAKSKYPNGFTTTTMNVPGPCQPCILLSQTLQQGAKAIGITINFNVMPGPPRFQVILDHKPGLGIQVLGQAPDTPHPLQFQDLLYPSSHAAPGFENSANLKNPAVDKLIREGLREHGPQGGGAQRRSRYRRSSPLRFPTSTCSRSPSRGQSRKAGHSGHRSARSTTTRSGSSTWFRNSLQAQDRGGATSRRGRSRRLPRKRRLRPRGGPLRTTRNALHDGRPSPTPEQYRRRIGLRERRPGNRSRSTRHGVRRDPHRSDGKRDRDQERHASTLFPSPDPGRRCGTRGRDRDDGEIDRRGRLHPPASTRRPARPVDRVPARCDPRARARSGRGRPTRGERPPSEPEDPRGASARRNGDRRGALADRTSTRSCGSEIRSRSRKTSPS